MIDADILAAIQFMYILNLLASISIMAIGYRCLRHSYDLSGGFLFFVAFLLLLFGGYTFDTKLIECPECHATFTKDNIKPVIQSSTETVDNKKDSNR